MPLLCFNWGIAGRCAHKTPAIGGRFPHLRSEKCKLSRTGKSAKRRQWRMKRAGFEEVARLARPKGRGNRNATTVNCGARRINRHAHVAAIYDQDYLPPAGGKVCDAFWCVMRVSASIFHFWRCFAPEAQNARRGCVSCFVRSTKCAWGTLACFEPKARNAPPLNLD